MNFNNSTKLGVTDLLMLLTCFFWALNFTVVKIALREFAPHAFNASRLVMASALLLVYLWRKEGRLGVGWTDLLKLAALGVVGNTFYQLLFINGLRRTTASSTSLIMTMSPILIAVLGSLFGVERIRWAGWAGILVAFSGLYLVVFGHPGRPTLGSESLTGDLFILAANLCWAVYTVFSRPLLSRMSPLKLTTLTFALGALFYLPAGAHDIVVTPWLSLSLQAWGTLLYSAVFSFAVGYVIWYSSVKRVGSTKTGVFGYITPVFAVIIARIFLAEDIHLSQAAGVAVIFLGFYLTRFSDRLSPGKRAAV
jgi:drug/metabolite transporter (DMT)-like permease